MNNQPLAFIASNQPGNALRRFTPRFLPALSSLFPFALIIFGCLTTAYGAPESLDIAISADRFEKLGGVTGKLAPAPQVPLLTAPAKVVVPPEHEYLVTASQAGLITRLHASIGDSVRKGDILAELNSPELLTLQQLYLKAENELRLSLLSYQRDKKLFEEGVIAQRRWQETESQYHILASEANERRQLLAIAGMTEPEIKRLQNTHQLGSKLSVRAPISGVVLERMGIAGSRVDILAPLYRVADLNPLWLEINIPQERAANVNVGDSVGADAEGANSTEIATIAQLGRNVDSANQTVLARAQLREQSADFRPGQRLNIQILQKAPGHAFTVPNEAIAQREGRSYLFVRIATGFRAAAVDVIGKGQENSVVSAELSGEEAVAVKGTVALKAVWLGLGSDE